MIIRTGRSSSIFRISSSAVTPSMPGIITSTIAASNGIDRAQLEPLRRRRGQPHLVALAGQQRLEDLAHDLLVVDDQNGAVVHRHLADLGRPAYDVRSIFAATASGRRIENRVPCPT